MLKLLCLTAVLLQCRNQPVAGRPAQNRLKIISIVSSSSDVNAPLWTRGEDIVPGALLAAEEVNSKENILSGFHIEIVPLFVQDCSLSEGMLEIVQELLSTNTPVIGVTGLFCCKLVEALSPLLNNKTLSLLQLSGTTILSSTLENRYPDFFSIVPGIETQIEALFELLEALNWKKLNIVSGRTVSEDHYIKAAEVLGNSLLKSERSFQIMLKIEFDNSVEYLIEQLRSSTSRIIVALLPPETAADLLCRAFKNELTWPRYVWIMLDLTVNETAHCDGGLLLKAMENVIIINTILKQTKNVTLVSNNTYEIYVQRISRLHLSSSYTHNPYTNVLYDSVWALALAVNSSLQTLEFYNLTLTARNVFGTLSKETTQTIKESLLLTSFTGASGKFNNSQIQNSLAIHQIQNESFILFGKCCSLNGSTLFQYEFLDEIIPRDEIPRIYQFLPLVAAATISTAACICVIFVTVVLVIFLCYWRAPEVCASSRRLSLCIFLGCYLLLVSALSHSITGGMYVEPGFPVCIIIVASSTIGIDVILATLLAKTMRIVYIFTKFKKIGRACSDNGLITLVVLIVSGKVIFLALWSAIDFHHIIEISELGTDHKGLPHYNVFQRCNSRDAGVWLALGLAYSGVICVALAALAYRTRKIKRKDFKDTKKINGFIISLVIVCAVCTPLWGIFQIVGIYQASYYVGSIGYMALPIMCQLFLIIPKIGPSLKKTLGVSKSGEIPAC